MLYGRSLKGLYPHTYGRISKILGPGCGIKTAALSECLKSTKPLRDDAIVLIMAIKDLEFCAAVAWFAGYSAQLRSQNPSDTNLHIISTHERPDEKKTDYLKISKKAEMTPQGIKETRNRIKQVGGVVDLMVFSRGSYSATPRGYEYDRMLAQTQMLTYLAADGTAVFETSRISSQASQNLLGELSEYFKKVRLCVPVGTLPTSDVCWVVCEGWCGLDVSFGTRSYENITAVDELLKFQRSQLRHPGVPFKTLEELHEKTIECMPSLTSDKPWFRAHDRLERPKIKKMLMNRGATSCPLWRPKSA